MPEAEDNLKQDGHKQPRILTSSDLLQGSREVWIEHDGQLYRLRLTSRGKLILTK